MNDEFVIYDADQAKVEYIVHYKSSNYAHQTIPTQLPTNQKFKKVTFRAADLRAFKSDPVFIKAWQADSHFYKMQAQQPGFSRSRKVKSVDVILNPTSGAAFEKKKTDFKRKGINCNPIYGYHGTNYNVIDDILKKNFDIKFAKRQLHGKGHYFSEYPEVSLGYGPGLIFCELLTGEEYRGPEFEWKKYGDSKVCPKYGMLENSIFNYQGTTTYVVVKLGYLRCTI